MTKLKPWLPSIALIFLMILLIAAARVYIGGPDGIEIVWKGELSFADTVVNLADYVGIPKDEFSRNFKNPSLISQMEEMGLFDDEPRFKHRIKKNPWLRSAHDDKNSDEQKEHSPVETGATDDSKGEPKGEVKGGSADAEKDSGSAIEAEGKKEASELEPKDGKKED